MKYFKNKIYKFRYRRNKRFSNVIKLVSKRNQIQLLKVKNIIEIKNPIDGLEAYQTQLKKGINEKGDIYEEITQIIIMQRRKVENMKEKLTDTEDTINI